MAENDKVDIEDTEIEPVADNDTTDWKARSQFLEGKISAHRARTRELKSKLSEYEKATQPKADVPQQQKKSGFDYAEKAYLKASGIDSNDFDYLFEASQATGKDLDTLLGTKYVQAELRERRELRQTENAQPDGTKRSGNAASNTMEYWLAKVDAGTATVADIPDRKMQQEVVNAKIAREKAKSQFTDNSIV